MALLGLCIPQVALGGLKQTPRVMSLPWSDVTPPEWCHTLWNCVNNPPQAVSTPLEQCPLCPGSGVTAPGLVECWGTTERLGALGWRT